MEDLTTCPFCESLLEPQPYNARSRSFYVSCPQCSKYEIEARFVEKDDEHLEKIFGPVGSALRTNASRVLSRDPDVTVLRTPEDLMCLAAKANEV